MQTLDRYMINLRAYAAGRAADIEFFGIQPAMSSLAIWVQSR